MSEIRDWNHSVCCLGVSKNIQQEVIAKLRYKMCIEQINQYSELHDLWKNETMSLKRLCYYQLTTEQVSAVRKYQLPSE